MATTGDDTACGQIDSPLKTIQAGINKVNIGGNVHVAAGTYNEMLNVNKAVTLLGPNAGISPNGGVRGPEAIIDPAGSTCPNDGGPSQNPRGSIWLRANGITIDGFEITGSASAGAIMTGTFASIGFSASDVAIKNNYFHDLTGSAIATAGGWGGTRTMNNWLVDNNKIERTTFVTDCYGAGYGSGIKLWDVGSATITNNVLSDIGFTGIDVVGSADIINGNTITNTFDNAIQTVAFSGYTVTNNVITNANTGDAPQTGGIKVFGASNVLVTGNTITGSKNGFVLDAGTDAAGITLNHNKFSGNTVSGVDNTVGTGTLDAANNYWGDASGPYTDTHTCGLGDKVIGLATFCPFYKDAGLTELDTICSCQVCGNGIVETGEQCDDGTAQTPATCGIGVCQATVADTCVNCMNVACTPGLPFSENDTTCDGLDDDCSGAADEDYTSSVTTCGTGVCAATGSTSCVNGNEANSCTPGTPQTEICDGLDNDCDGSSDEDDVCKASGELEVFKANHYCKLDGKTKASIRDWCAVFDPGAAITSLSGYNLKIDEHVIPTSSYTVTAVSTPCKKDRYGNWNTGGCGGGSYGCCPVTCTTKNYTVYNIKIVNTDIQAPNLCADGDAVPAFFSGSSGLKTYVGEAEYTLSGVATLNECNKKPRKYWHR